MRMLGRIAVTTAVLLPMVAGPVAAQNYRWDVGVNGGYSWYRSMIDQDETGVNGSVRFEPGWLVGAQLGFWAAPSIGLRLNGTYTDRPLRGTDFDLTVPGQTTTTALDHVNLWSGSLDLLWRFANRPAASWMGTEVLPYLALGLGAKWINPAGDNFMCVPTGETAETACVPFEAGTTTFSMNEQRRLMGLVGLGTDIRMSPNFALRLELNDRIYRPEIRATTVTATGFETGEQVGRTVHEIAGQVGLHLLFGLERPAPVAVAPAPAPLPPPAPAPAPAPPAEEAITVCVVDPASPQGVRMQTAYFRPATGDTLVTIDGERRPIVNLTTGVPVVREAGWYVRGEPLVLNIGTERVEYVTYMGTRHIEADRLAYLGTINGYPVFADRDEVADFVTTINTARGTQYDRDLGVILAEDRNLRTQMANVSYLYVPVDATGCVFQAVQPMVPVGKGR